VYVPNYTWIRSYDRQLQRLARFENKIFYSTFKNDLAFYNAGVVAVF
jgi:hypothetical protein